MKTYILKVLCEGEDSYKKGTVLIEIKSRSLTQALKDWREHNPEREIYQIFGEL